VGLLGGIIGGIAHAIPGVSQVYDATTAAFGAVKALTKNKTTGPIVTASLPMPVPGILGSSGGKSMPTGGGTVPTLPALPGTSITRSSGTFMTPDGQIHDKTWRQGKGHITKRGVWSNRRRPRMNPMNVRAARRAVRRIHSAEKLFRQILSVAHPGKAHGRIAPKRSKR